MQVIVTDHTIEVTLTSEGVNWVGTPFTVIGARKARIAYQQVVAAWECHLIIDLGLETGCTLQDQQFGEVVTIGEIPRAHEVISHM